MEPENRDRTLPRLVAAWEKLRASVARIPTAWVILGLFLLAAVLMAIHTSFAAKDSSLRVKVQHSLRGGQLYVWVGGDLSYSGRLTGYTKKKFGLLPESVQGSLSETLAVPSGKHQVRVRIASDSGAVQEDTIMGEFVTNSQRTLSISARLDDVALSWQGGGNVPVGNVPVGRAPVESSSGIGWMARYAGTLILTAAGSIISAVTGYAIRELPGYIRARQGAAPKI